jgi:hypothetical protein
MILRYKKFWEVLGDNRIELINLYNFLWKREVKKSDFCIKICVFVNLEYTYLVLIRLC